MEQREDAMEMLDVMIQPGFCVQDHIIVKANRSALSCHVEVGTDVRQLLHTGKEEYDAFQGGCLDLTLCIGGQYHRASIHRMRSFDVFLFQEDDDQAELKAMALAATQLRSPLNCVMTTAERLFPVSAMQDDAAIQGQVDRLNRGLMQLQRIVINMADANRCSTVRNTWQETREICSFLRELFDRCADLVSHVDIQLTFQCLPDPIYCLIDPEQLERAVMNIISNARSSMPNGGKIEASLTRRGNMLSLQIQDSGAGIAEGLQSTLHRRYQREPALEDPKFGIGLGMVFIRSAAACHGGTVLVDQPEGAGTRVTMTLAIRQNNDSMVRTPMLRPDYAGERDHGLLEFSDFLPASLYKPE